MEFLGPQPDRQGASQVAQIAGLGTGTTRFFDHRDLEVVISLSKRRLEN